MADSRAEFSLKMVEHLSSQVSCGRWMFGSGARLSRNVRDVVGIDTRDDRKLEIKVSLGVGTQREV